MSLLLIRKEAGDTIIEVLISVLVVSSVLVSAFAVVNKTSQNTIQNQEHNVALKILEGQMERLKIASVDPDPSSQQMYTLNQSFCLNDSSEIKKNSPSGPPSTNTSDYASECIVVDGDSTVPYYISIKGVGAPVKETFTATAVWDGVTGSQDRVQIVYKLFKPGP